MNVNNLNRCMVLGHGFKQVATQVISHPQLRTLCLYKVEMDHQAAGEIMLIIKFCSFAMSEYSHMDYIQDIAPL